MNELIRTLKNADWTKTQRIKAVAQRFSDDDIERIGKILVSCPKIGSLEMYACKLTRTQIFAIARNLKMCNLRGLQLSHNSLGPGEANAIACGMMESLTLRRLDISFNKIGTEGAKDIAYALRNDSALDTLLLQRNNIKAEGAIELAKTIGSGRTNVITLDVSNNSIKNEGAMAIANMISTANIERLAVDLNGIDATGIEAICRAAIQRGTLRRLSLSGNSIQSATCMESIVLLLRKTQLESLELNGCNISNERLLVLSEGIKDSNYIQSLSIADNYIMNDICMDKFMNTIGFHLTLKEIKTNESGITRHCRQRLERVLDINQGERAKIMTAMLCASVNKRAGYRSHLSMLPKALIRHLATYLQPTSRQQHGQPSVTVTAVVAE